MFICLKVRIRGKGNVNVDGVYWVQKYIKSINLSINSQFLRYTTYCG